MARETQAAIVLAGGKSRRMGQDKALLPFGGMSLLEHVVAHLLTIASDVVVVADSPGRYTLPCGRIIADLYPGAGPVGGILTGLSALGNGAHIVVACDMPAVSTSVLSLLLKAVATDIDAVIPEVAGELEPLCAVYRHTAVPKLMRFLEDGGRSAREALNTLRVKRVGEGVLRRLDPPLLTFTNLNSPDDLRRFVEAIRS